MFPSVIRTFWMMLIRCCLMTVGGCNYEFCYCGYFTTTFLPFMM